jgi:3-(3-hydroxy-phenyl)propionate hydroxylase
MNEEVDVAIIGAGPAGVTLGNLLGQYGLRVVIFERDAAIYPLPRAIHFDGEVMRVFETAGLRAEVEAISRPGLKGMHFVNAAGETLMIRGGTAERGPHGCASNHYFHQPELEAVLRRGLQRFSHVRLLLRHEVTDAQPQPGGGATLQVADLDGNTTSTWRARWVVGCDGARSLVRRLLGSPMLDLGLHQPWLVFDVRLKQPVEGLPAYTVQHCDPARPIWSSPSASRNWWRAGCGPSRPRSSAR